MGAVIRIEIQGVDALNRLANRLAGVDSDELLDGVGAMLERQTRRRISGEKTSPDGIDWPQLSKRYEQNKRKHSSGGLLELSGGLLDSIQFSRSGSVLNVGTNAIYAATHQYGDARRNIPRREFEGVSADNADEISELIADWVDGVLSG